LTGIGMKLELFSGHKIAPLQIALLQTCASEIPLMNKTLESYVHKLRREAPRMRS